MHGFFTENVTGYYAHAQTVSTRPLFGGEGPGNEANTAQDTIYRIAGNFRQGKISADLFSRTRDWAKLNSRALNFNLTLSTLHFSKSSSSWLR